MTSKISSQIDLNNLVECHRKAFPFSLSSKLNWFYTRKMLSWYLNDERGLLIHIEQQNKIIGYCGAIKTKVPGLEGSSTSMLQYSFKTMVIALAIKPWLIFHEENVKKIPLIKRNILLKLGLKRKKNTKGVYEEDFVPFWGLVVIGVDPSFQGKGLGGILLKEFEKLAKEDGVKRIVLSVKKDNSKAMKSYKNNNWEIKFSNDDSHTMYKNI